MALIPHLTDLQGEWVVETLAWGSLVETVETIPQNGPLRPKLSDQVRLLDIIFAITQACFVQLRQRSCSQIGQMERAVS